MGLNGAEVTRFHPRPPQGILDGQAGLDALGFTYRGAIFQGSRSAYVPETDRFELGGCTVDAYGPETKTNFDQCSQAGSDTAAGEIFLMGDSHALAFLPMLKKAGGGLG